MSKIVVADSSCLIGLSRIGELDILRQLFGRIVIPAAVFDEVVTSGAGRPGAQEVENAEWIETREVGNEFAARAFRLSLAAGESEAIALASEYEVDFVILDDWNARQIGLELSLPVIGTVAVLSKAAQKGLIPDFDSALDSLRKAGFRYSLS